MPNEERALATIDYILKLEPIPDADKIEVAQVRGWKCVVKKGEFKEGDVCVYFEIDSVLPNDERFKFLKNSWNKRMEGYRVRTIRLRGQISQGLALPLKEFPEIADKKVGTDVTEDLGVRLYQPPEPSGSGTPKALGSFPTGIIPKTDEERVENVNVVKLLQTIKSVYDYDGSAYMTSAKDIDTVEVLAAEGGETIKGGPFSNNPQVPGSVYYMSEKLDGTSLTVYRNGDHVGVCSRNRELDISDSALEGGTSPHSTWIKENKVILSQLSHFEQIKEAYHAYHFPSNFALQGELIGPGVQKNPYGLDTLTWYVFSIFDIDEQTYLEVDTMMQFLNVMHLNNAPFIGVTLTAGVVHTLLKNQKEFQKNELFMNNSSMLNPQTKPEGIVYRPFWSIPRDAKPHVSFKVLNDEYLLNEE